MIFFQLLILLMLLLLQFMTFSISGLVMMMMMSGDAFPFGFPEHALRFDAFGGGEELFGRDHDRWRVRGHRALLAAQRRLHFEAGGGGGRAADDLLLGLLR